MLLYVYSILAASVHAELLVGFFQYVRSQFLYVRTGYTLNFVDHFLRLANHDLLLLERFKFQDRPLDLI